MDRSLRISVLLQAGDRASRPLRDIATGGSRVAQSLKAARDQLKVLNTEQGDIDGFRRLRAGLRQTDQALGTAQARVAQLTREMAQSAKPTRDMKRDLAAATREVESLTRQQQKSTRQLGELGTRLRDAGVDTNRLSQRNRELRGTIDQVNGELAEQTRRFEQAEDRRRRFGAAREKFARTQNMATGMAAGGAAAIGTGVAMGAGIWRGVKAAQEYQSVMTDIGQKADLTREASSQLGRNLLIAARAANQMPSDLQAGVDALAGLGAKVPDAVAMMTPIGRAATAYKAEIADLSAAAFAATDNLKVPVGQTAKIIDVMASAGKAGAFEIKDMAQYFPALTAAYQGLGQTGTGAVADLAAGLQIARKGAGDAATAGTNLANILQKITSPATNRAFKKMGVDLPKSLQQAYKQGKTPLEAIAELTNKTLKGDLSKLGNLFEDSQVQQGLRPLIQNMEEYRRIRAEAAGASGTTDRDFAERMKDSAEQSKALEVNAKALGVTMGALLLPSINKITERANAWATWLTTLTERHPRWAKAIGIGALALSGLFVVMGGGAIALAGLMLPIAIINSGLVAMGVAGGVASIGLLPILGTVALIVAGVALFAGAAYLLYKNWGAIGTFFSGLWSGIETRFASASDAVTGVFAGMWAGVKSLFSLSLGEIYQGLFRALGFALGALYRFGGSVFGWLTGTLPGLLASGWSTAWAGFTGALGASWAWLTTRLPAMLANGWNMAWSGFKAAMHAAFVTLPTMFVNFGVMIVQGLWNGIKSAPGRLFEAGKRLAGSLAGGFRAGAQIRSPSRVFMALGGHIVGGLNAGLDRGHDDAVDRVRRLTRRMAAAAAVPALATAGLVTPGIAAAETLAVRNAEIRITDTASRRPAPGTAGASGGNSSGSRAALAALPPVTFNIYPPADASPQDIGMAVRAEWEKLMREQARVAASTFSDPPDW
jgi:TP901 family phage tail tape measure protein